MTDLSASSVPDGIIWIDMFDPTTDEREFVERLVSLTLPTQEDLREIETSSRLYTEQDALFMSAPLISKSTTSMPDVSPVGLILTRKLLITIRYADFVAFTTFAKRLPRENVCHHSSAGAFVGLLDAVIDRMADVLEHVGDDLATLSRRTFRTDTLTHEKRRALAKENADMRVILRRIGRAGDLASTIRDSLLSVNRMVAYMSGLAGEWTPEEVKPFLKTLREDTVSLNDYVGHLTTKVQLLLDATLGLISIEQNNTFRILTIVSVVGIPPTLIASMYGMNFRHMPELEWAWGYPWGLGLIALSAIIPLVLFKLRGWS
ncbi:MAG: magnesium transporter CorA family protein [Parvibaculaceae bacterium]